MTALLIAAILLAGQSNVSGHQISEASPPANAEILDSAGEVESYVPAMQAGDTVPDVRLTDQFGRALSMRNGENPTIVSFMETRCPDTRICPLVTAKFGRLERLIAGTHIRLVEITLDPAHDRPLVLARYSAAAGVRGTNWFLGTGAPDDIATIAKRFGIYGDLAIGGNLGHTEAVAILSGDGVLRTRIDGIDWAPDDVAAQAFDIAGLGSNPFRRAALALFARLSAACGSTGAAGLPIIAALATFGLLATSFGYIIVRLFAPAFTDRL